MPVRIQGWKWLIPNISQVHLQNYDLSKGEFPITTLCPITHQVRHQGSRWIYQDQSNSLELLNEQVQCYYWSRLGSWRCRHDWPCRELLSSMILSIKSSNSWKPVSGTAAISSLSGIMKHLKKADGLARMRFFRSILMFWRVDGDIYHRCNSVTQQSKY